MPLTAFIKRNTTPDRAIIASVAAMLAMNVVVLSQQFQAGPALVSGGLA